MPTTTILHKRSTTAGSIPQASQLAPGEWSLNLADRLAYYRDASGIVRSTNLTTDAEKVASGPIATAILGLAQDTLTALDGKLDKTGDGSGVQVRLDADGALQPLSKILGQTSRTLESFGPCGNGSVAEDHAAWLKAQAWCCAHDTTLVLSPGVRYLLDFRFTVTGAVPRVRAPYFRLVADGAEIKLVGDGSGVRYLGMWYADKTRTEYCEVQGGTWFPGAAGTQTAFEASFKYNPSNWLRNSRVSGMVSGLDNPNDQTVYWQNFLHLHNAWAPSIEHILAFQPFDKRAGDAILLDGLTVGTRARDLHIWWFQRAFHCTFERMRGLTGSFVSGAAFFTGELLTGQTSGAMAYACVSLPYPGASGTTCPVSVQDASGGVSGVAFANGETVVGAVSGARFTVSGSDDTYQSMEAVYLADSEFVYCDYGFDFDNSSPVSFTKQIGHQIVNVHINSYVAAIRAVNTFQVKISSGLWQAASTGWIGLILTACDEWDVGSGLELHGQGKANTTGTFMVGGCNNNRLDASIRFCTTGLALGDALTKNNDFGLSFSTCGTDINNNGSPTLPSANGNSFWRTVSRQAAFVGGYNK